MVLNGAEGAWCPGPSGARSGVRRQIGQQPRRPWPVRHIGLSPTGPPRRASCPPRGVTTKAPSPGDHKRAVTCLCAFKSAVTWNRLLLCAFKSAVTWRRHLATTNAHSPHTMCLGPLSHPCPPVWPQQKRAHLCGHRAHLCGHAHLRATVHTYVAIMPTCVAKTKEPTPARLSSRPHLGASCSSRLSPTTKEPSAARLCCQPLSPSPHTSPSPPPNSPSHLPTPHELVTPCPSPPHISPHHTRNRLIKCRSPEQTKALGHRSASPGQQTPDQTKAVRSLCTQARTSPDTRTPLPKAHTAASPDSSPP